jgi:hypothetical protein
MKRLWQFRVFALEMVVGLLIGAFGLLQLLFKVRLLPVTADPELMEKIAAALVTIGGTVLLSGIFRFAFSVRLDDTEQRILDSLRLGRNEIVAAITNFHPKGAQPAARRSMAEVQSFLLAHQGRERRDHVAAVPVNRVAHECAALS